MCLMHFSFPMKYAFILVGDLVEVNVADVAHAAGVADIFRMAFTHFESHKIPPSEIYNGKLNSLPDQNVNIKINWYS